MRLASLSAWTRLAVVLFVFLAVCATLLLKVPGNRALAVDPAYVAQQFTGPADIVVLWSSPYPLPESALTPLRGILDDRFGRPGDAPVAVFCGSPRCVEQVLELRRTRVRAELLDLPKAFSGTPLADFIAHHSYYKLRLGENYPATLDWAILTTTLVTQPNATVFNLQAVDRNALDDLRDMAFDSALSPWVVVPRTIGSRTPNATVQVTQFLAARLDFANQVDAANAWSRAFAQKIPPIPQLGTILPSWESRLEGNVMLDTLVESEESFGLTERIKVQELNYSADHDLGAVRFGVLTSEPSQATNFSVETFSQEMEMFAALQHFPYVTDLVNPAFMDQIELAAGEKMILFGPKHFERTRVVLPPLDKVDLILTSIDIDPAARPELEQTKQRLNKTGAVGARDFETKSWLEEIGVKTYYSGWASALLSNPYRHSQKTKSRGPVVIDVPETFLEHIPPNRRETTRLLDLTSDLRTMTSRTARFDLAYAIIVKLSSVDVVITSQPQIAAVAAAVGASVIHVGPNVTTELPSFSSVSSRRPLYHQAETARDLGDFKWEEPPQNPGIRYLRKLRAALWDSLRAHPAIVAGTATYGVVPLEAPMLQGISQMKWHLVQTSNQLTWRNIRTIESIFYHHPDMHIVIHSAVDLVQVVWMDVKIFEEAGYRISVEEFDLNYALERAKTAFDPSLIKAFSANLADYANGPYWFAHSADLFRLILLYFEGGIYTDTDMIIVKSFDGFDKALGVEDLFSDGSLKLNNAVYKFTEPRSPFLHACVIEFLTTYRKLAWDYNGPALVSRVFHAHPEMHCDSGKTCEIRYLPQEAFYPMRWDRVDRLCFGQSTPEGKKALSDTIRHSSFAVHLNNHATKNRVELEPGTVCKRLLSEYCILCNRQY